MGSLIYSIGGSRASGRGRIFEDGRDDSTSGYATAPARRCAFGRGASRPCFVLPRRELILLFTMRRSGWTTMDKPAQTTCSPALLAFPYFHDRCQSVSFGCVSVGVVSQQGFPAPLGCPEKLAVSRGCSQWSGRLLVVELRGAGRFGTRAEHVEKLRCLCVPFS